MKKSIYLLAATALMASCNQDVLVDNMTDAQPEVNRHIGFDTFVDKATRAEGTNSNALNDFYTTFYVYGWKTVGTETTCVFDNIPVEFFATDTRGEVVYKEEGQKPSDEWNFAADSWYYENVRYWDKMASNYQFSAYTPAAEDVVTCTSAGIITIGSESKPVTVDDTNLLEDAPSTDLAFIGFDKDYMTATSTDANGTVALTFKHLQAKLNIRIKLDEHITTAQDVKVTEIGVYNLNDKGYYTNATTTTTDEEGNTTNVPIGVTGWTTGTATENYVPTVETDYLINNADAENDVVSYHNYYVLEQLIIPQTIAKHKYETEEPTSSLTEYAEACIYVEYTIGTETFKSFSPLANIFTTADTYDLEGGKQYTINVIIGPAPIEFTAEVTPWENAIEKDHVMD